MGSHPFPPGGPVGARHLGGRTKDQAPSEGVEVRLERVDAGVALRLEPPRKHSRSVRSSGFGSRLDHPASARTAEAFLFLIFLPEDLLRGKGLKPLKNFVLKIFLS